MKALQEYFENSKGFGVLATADSNGKVNAAIYSRPHFLEKDTVTFIMRDRLTHHNLLSNPSATFLFVEEGTNIFMSGSYIGSDLDVKGDSADINFARDVLHFNQRTGHAVRTGGVYPTDYAKPAFKTAVGFTTSLSGSTYQAEASDAKQASMASRAA